MSRRQAGTEIPASFSKYASPCRPMLPSSGSSNPASRWSTVVLLRLLSPTKPIRAAGSTWTLESRRNRRSCLRSWTRSTGTEGGQPARCPAEQDEHAERHEDEQHGEGHRRVDVGLEGDIDGEGHGLRSARQIAGEGDGGAEFAKGA